MSNKPKFCLDTSIFHELFKADQKDFEDTIEKYAPGRRFAAYYTAIELNRGFLRTLVEHHRTVTDLQDVTAAIRKLGNGYGRVKSNAITLEVYMLKFNHCVSDDYRQYAASLESVIFDMSDRATQLVRHFVGNFKDHALANLDLYNSEEYEGFLERCEQHSDVNLEDFWTRYDAQLSKMLDEILKRAPRLKKSELELYEFIENVLSGESPAKYEHLSDFVISLDCPSGYGMIAHDHSFEMLCPLQGKNVQYVTFP